MQRPNGFYNSYTWPAVWMKAGLSLRMPGAIQSWRGHSILKGWERKVPKVDVGSIHLSTLQGRGEDTTLLGTWPNAPCLMTFNSRLVYALLPFPHWHGTCYHLGTLQVSEETPLFLRKLPRISSQEVTYPSPQGPKAPCAGHATACPRILLSLLTAHPLPVAHQKPQGAHKVRFVLGLIFCLNHTTWRVIVSW